MQMMRLLVTFIVAVVATAYAQSLAPETGITSTSTVLTSLIGSSTDCTQLRQWRNGCCTDTSSPCCRQCASATSVFEGCPDWKRDSTCCKEPGQTCCKKDCWIEPEVKEVEEHRQPLMKDDLDGCAQKQKDVSQCCQPGETTCCTKCPLPFVFAEIDESAPGTEIAPPPPPPPTATVTPQPPAPAPAPAPAPVPAPTQAPAPAVPPQRRLIFAKVDCTAEKRTATCCRGPVDHKYRCCNQDLQCQVAQSKIGDMKMGTLCLESVRLSTCCSQPGQTCCRQCATPPALIPAQPISSVVPPACPAAVTTCCTATVTSCCNKCSQ